MQALSQLSYSPECREGAQFTEAASTHQASLQNLPKEHLRGRLFVSPRPKMPEPSHQLASTSAPDDDFSCATNRHWNGQSWVPNHPLKKHL